MLELRSYQQEAVDFLLTKKRACIQAPAGAGKTLIAASAVAKKVRPGNKVYWLAHTIEQVDQGIKAIQSTPGPSGVDFSVCCYASYPDLRNADLVVVDENHWSSSEQLQEILNQVPRDCILWGFSATPFGDDSLRNTLIQDMFQEFMIIDRSEIEASGHLIKGEVIMFDIDKPGEFDAEINAQTEVETAVRFRRFPFLPGVARNMVKETHRRRVKNQITQNFIQQNVARNLCAIHRINKETEAGHSCLMLVHSIQHGEELLKSLPNAVMAHSKMKKRKETIESVRRGDIKQLLATSLADEGLDIKILSRLILMGAGRSSTKLEQRCGRILRTNEGKTDGIIYDFLDRGAEMAHAQAKARIRTYKNLGYPIKTIYGNEIV